MSDVDAILHYVLRKKLRNFQKRGIIAVRS